MASRVAWFVLGLAIVLGYVATQAPHLFLKLPMGFIPWAILGNQMPPFFDYASFQPEEFKTWIKADDVLISAGAKAGTNWLLYTSHLIRTKGEIEKYPYEDIMYTTPWVSLIHKPTQKWLDLKSLMNTTVLKNGKNLKDYWDHPDYPFRIFKAHEMPIGTGLTGAVMDVQNNPDVKFVAMVRPPLDVLKSFYPFFKNHHPEFKKIWGDFPVNYQSKEEQLKDFMPGGVLEHLLFAYPLGWWPYRNLKNVKLLHYNDAIQDSRRLVAELAEFFGVELTDAEIDKINGMVGFDVMKKDCENCFDYVLWGNPEFEHTAMTPASLLSTGKKGGGQAFFTPEEQEAIMTTWKGELTDPELQDFVLNGYGW